MGCVPDAWVAVPSQDAGIDATQVDAPVLDAAAQETGVCTHDAASACGCPSGQMRCGDTCVEGPRHLYRGEGNARDGVGAQHATQGNAGFEDGRVGRAFAFGGMLAQQYVTLPPEVLDFGDGDFTVSFWFVTTLDGNLLSKRAACWEGPASTGMDLRLTYAGNLLFELWSTTGLVTLYRTPPGLNDGVWHHLAILREGPQWRLHVDGDAVASGGITGALRDPTHTPVYLGVGRCVLGAPGSNGNQDGSTWLNGRVDELAVFPRALSATELLALVQGRCAL